MRAETLFCNEISKLKRSVFVRAVQQTLLIAILFLSATSAVVLIIEKAGYLESEAFGWLYIPLFGLCLFTGLLITFLKRKDFLEFLIESDSRLKLQDRLSTAYEYQRSGKKSDLTELLIKDATGILCRLGKRKLLPPTFSYLHLFVIFLIFINIALYSSDYFGSNTQSTLIKPDKLDRIGALINKYTETRVGDQKERKSRPPHNFARELEILNHKLQQGSMARNQLIPSLKGFLERVQGKQTDVANRLGAQLTAAKIEEISASPIPTLQNLSARELQKLKTLLGRLSDHPITESIDRHIETLQELQRLEKLLSHIIEDIDENASDLTKSERNQTPGSHSAGDLKQTAKDNQDVKTPGKFPDTQPNRENLGQPPGARRPHGEARELSEELDSPDGYSTSAGRGKSTGKKKPRSDIEKSHGPGIQDKMISSQIQNYLIHIRSLTAIGESAVEAEDIMRTYQQEIEGILKKEDIPLNYREYIKHYFISIGLKSDEDVNEIK